MVSLRSTLSEVEKKLAVELARVVQASTSNEEEFMQKLADADKVHAGMIEKVRLFERQLETSESGRRADAEAAAVASKELSRKLADLETERKRLQDEVESLETSLSEANKSAVAAQWQVLYEIN
jgi:hypothetical protein